MKFERHLLVYLMKGSQQANIQLNDAAKWGKNTHLFFNEWVQKGKPFIITRQPDYLSNDLIHLGVPFYDKATESKYRYTFVVSKHFIKEVVQLPTLQCVMPGIFIKTPHIFDTYVYGSYAWEYLTQETYIRPQSDLDLLINYNNCTLTALNTYVADIALQLYPRNIDAEIRFLIFGECALNELIDLNRPTILFKQLHAVTLIKRVDLYDYFPALIQ